MDAERAGAPETSQPPYGWGPMQAVHDAFDGWRFPAFVLFTLLFFSLLLAFILVLPPAETGIGAFAAEFKTWCFGYDPGTGRMEWSYVFMAFTGPIMMAAIILPVWSGPLRTALERPLALLPCAASALLLTAVLSAGLTSLGRKGRVGELPFPAERLRLARIPPAFTLTDQDGRSVSLRDLRGSVVMLTAVYRTCVHTCPFIMGQAKRAVGALSDAQRRGLTVMAINLDPENDDSHAMKLMEKQYGVAAPRFRLVTGEPKAVHRALDALEIASLRNQETGVLEHANIFYLIDREGRIAYRLSLGEQQERWLVSGLRLLLSERAPAAG